jgi:crotonobetainyl-CoA:carnitine CoA-transferase CaiB-like acyl-CoA transferase
LLAELLGHPDWSTDPRFLHNPERVENRDALDAAITEALRDHVAEDITMSLLAKGAPAGAVLTIPEVAEHPHTKHREMVVELDGYRGTGIPIKMGRTPGSVRTTPPHYGSATRDVLAGLGYDRAQVDELITDGVAYTERAKPPT